MVSTLLTPTGIFILLAWGSKPQISAVPPLLTHSLVGKGDFFFVVIFYYYYFFSLFCSALNLGSQESCTSPVA